MSWFARNGHSRRVIKGSGIFGQRSYKKIGMNLLDRGVKASCLSQVELDTVASEVRIKVGEELAGYKATIDALGQEVSDLLE